LEVLIVKKKRDCVMEKENWRKKPLKLLRDAHPMAQINPLVLALEKTASPIAREKASSPDSPRKRLLAR
jgi:hypothetical protein